MINSTLLNKKFAVVVLSAKNSEIIQQISFKYGYGWTYGGKKVSYINEDVLYFYKKTISYGSLDYLFNQDNVEILTPQDFFDEFGYN